MIYLYTGSNGSGKTLNSIKFICEVLNPDNSRPVFTFSPPNQPLGIEEAGLLDWESLTVDRAREWFDFPDGSIFFFDEFRHVFPWRDNRTPVPEYVDRLAEHRSKGFDFVFSAQKPASQFDPAIQGFIEEHRHLEGVGGSAKSRHFIYQSFCSTPMNPTKLQKVETKTVPFDKKYYRYYRSASIHTHKNRLPYKKLLMLLPLLLLIPLLFYIAYAVLTSPDKPSVSSVAGITDTLLSSPSGDYMSLDGYIDFYTPRLEGLPHTAPAYDDIMKPVVAPKPAACILRHETDSCRCYTQQATPIDTPDAVCRLIVANGWFDPSKSQRSSKGQQGSAAGGAGVSHRAASPGL